MAINNLDNRNIHKTEALEEIENDNTPIDEGANPKDDPEADGHIDNPEDQENYTPDDNTPTEQEDYEDILASDEEIDEETGEAKKKVVAKPEEKKTIPDVEERLAEQRREATIINEKNKQLSDAFSRANEVTEPTEEDLQKAARSDGFDWDELTNFEKSQFKKNFINEKKLSILNEVGSKVANIDEWAKSVDKFLDDNEVNQTNKLLIGKEGAFRSFAMKESHRGAAMDLLVSAFLHDLPPAAKKTNGSLMLTRTGGERVEKKNNLQDAEYVQSLRKSDPKEYKRLVSQGKISIEI